MVRNDSPQVAWSPTNEYWKCLVLLSLPVYISLCLSLYHSYIYIYIINTYLLRRNLITAIDAILQLCTCRYRTSFYPYLHEVLTECLGLQMTLAFDYLCPRYLNVCSHEELQCSHKSCLFKLVCLNLSPQVRFDGNVCWLSMHANHGFAESSVDHSSFWPHCTCQISNFDQICQIQLHRWNHMLLSRPRTYLAHTKWTVSSSRWKTIFWGLELTIWPSLYPFI